MFLWFTVVQFPTASSIPIPKGYWKDINEIYSSEVVRLMFTMILVFAQIFFEVKLL